MLTVGFLLGAEDWPPIITAAAMPATSTTAPTPIAMRWRLKKLSSSSSGSICIFGYLLGWVASPTCVIPTRPITSSTSMIPWY